VHDKGGGWDVPGVLLCKLGAVGAGVAAHRGADDVEYLVLFRLRRFVSAGEVWFSAHSEVGWGWTCSRCAYLRAPSDQPFD